MKEILTFLFWPNPGNATYTSPKAVVLMILCLAMIVASFGIKMWRRRLGNPVTKKLSRSWSGALLWFGIIGLVMVISRVESISFLSMRILWLVWLIILVLVVVLQVKIFRMRHYETLPREKAEQDPREKYLPRKKR